MISKHLLSLVLLGAFLMPLAVYAEPRTITVTVLDSKGGTHPRNLEGATVYAKALDDSGRSAIHRSDQVTNSQGVTRMRLDIAATLKRICFYAEKDHLQGWEQPCYGPSNLPGTIHIRFWKP